MKQRAAKQCHDSFTDMLRVVPAAASHELFARDASVRQAFSGVFSALGPVLAPLVPVTLPGFSISSRNGLMMSIGMGKTTVEFCSAPISASVWR